MSKLFEIAVTALLFGTFLFAAVKTPVTPEVPANLKAPEGEKVVFQAQARGSQIYLCQAGSDQSFSWVLKGPEAELFDATGSAVGHHSIGPSWKHSDGSEVRGKVVARQDAPEPDAVPWLLLQATSHSGAGTLSGVTSIQRIHTTGGQPPKAGSCDASALGKEIKSQYSAEYYFYAPAP